MSGEDFVIVFAGFTVAVFLGQYLYANHSAGATKLGGIFGAFRAIGLIAIGLFLLTGGVISMAVGIAIIMLAVYLGLGHTERAGVSVRDRLIG